jgi:hypothetical protein
MYVRHLPLSVEMEKIKEGPWIFFLGPSELWLSYGNSSALTQMHLKFKKGISVNNHANPSG